jgi:chemotaxis signal transduction protein
MLEKFHDQSTECQVGHGCEQAGRKDELHFLRFRIGHQELLISVEPVVQVSNAGSISAFPGNPRFFQGLFVTRGDEVTAVVNLADLLGLTSLKSIESQCCLVVMCGGERFGLLVDSVFGLVCYASSSLENSHNDLFGSCVPVVSGVVKDSESVLPVIDVKAIFKAVFPEEKKYDHTEH